MAISLTAEQSRACEDIIGWFDSTDHEDEPREFKLGGLAGSGKSTLMKYLMPRLPDGTVFATLTGKAASVLRSKGVPGVTLHSVFYKCNPGPPLTFTAVPEHELKKIPLLVVDEASMISQSLYDDITRHGFPVLWVGDHGQLPPIGDDPGLMLPANLDARLETIHRQALNSPIIRAAHRFRNGDFTNYPDEETEFGVFRTTTYANPSWLSAALAEAGTQVICATNRQRVSINDSIRQALDRHAVLAPGDRIICLRNNPEHGLFNGTICEVLQLGRTDGTITRTEVLPEGETTPIIVPVWMDGFGREKLPEEPRRGYFSKTAIPFDYAYAVTCHKFQGSQARNVLVAEVISPLWDRRRWLYTSCTRAEHSLTWVHP